MVGHARAALLLVCAAVACAALGVSASGAAARAAAEEAALLRDLDTPVASYLRSPARYARVAAAAAGADAGSLSVQTTVHGHDGELVDGSRYAGHLNRHNKRASRKSRHAKGHKGYYAPEADKYGKHEHEEEDTDPKGYKYPSHTHQPYAPAPKPTPPPVPVPVPVPVPSPPYKPEEPEEPKEEYDGPVHYPGEKEEPEPKYKELEEPEEPEEKPEEKPEEEPEEKPEEKPEYKEEPSLIPPYKDDKYEEKKYEKYEKEEAKYPEKKYEEKKYEEKKEEDSYGYDLEHKVCLQEVERLYFGTPDYPKPDVASNFTSIVACCNQVGGYDAYESYTGSAYGAPAAPKPVVGQCHWTVTPREPYGTYDHGYSEDHHNTKKLAATVEATCVLTNAAASECVPFGDFKNGAMVSFKLRHGYWYRTSAAAPSVVEEDEPEYKEAEHYKKYDSSKQYKEYQEDEYYEAKEYTPEPKEEYAENSYGKKQYKSEQYKKDDDGWFFPTAAANSKVATAAAPTKPAYSSDESYEYGAPAAPVVIEAVRGKADVFMGHISHVHEIASGDDGYGYAAAAIASYNGGYDGGYKYDGYGSGDYGHPVKGIKGGVLEFVAGFITTDGTVLYPDYNNTDLQPVDDYRELASEGPVPLVMPGAAWLKFDKGYPSKEDYYKDEEEDYYKHGDEYYKQEEYDEKPYAEEGYEKKPYKHPKYYKEPEYAADHDDVYPKPHHKPAYKRHHGGYVNPPPSKGYEGEEGYEGYAN